MIVNIGITSKNRLPHLKKCIKSLEENTLCDYNLFIADDGSDKNIIDYLYSGKIKNLKQVFLRPEPAGITHNFDLLFKYSEYHQWYFNQDENDLFCYLQDDTEIIQKVG